MEQEKIKRNPFLMKLRKIAISLKRNFYIIPMLFVASCMVQMTCSLYIYSPLTPRISSSQWNAFFIFLLTLFSIISCVNYLFYIQKVKDENKMVSLIFLILFYILIISQVAVEIPLMLEAHANIAVEQAAYEKELLENGANIDTVSKYLQLSKDAFSRYLTHLIMLGFTSLLVALSPWIQSILKKVRFKKISYDEK